MSELKWHLWSSARSMLHWEAWRVVLLWDLYFWQTSGACTKCCHPSERAVLALLSVTSSPAWIPCKSSMWHGRARALSACAGALPALGYCPRWDASASADRLSCCSLTHRPLIRCQKREVAGFSVSLGLKVVWECWQWSRGSFLPYCIPHLMRSLVASWQGNSWVALAPEVSPASWAGFREPELSFVLPAQAPEQGSWQLLVFLREGLLGEGWFAQSVLFSRVSGSTRWGMTRPSGPLSSQEEPYKAKGKHVLVPWSWLKPQREYIFLKQLTFKVILSLRKFLLSI